MRAAYSRTGKLHHPLARGVQDAHDLIIHAVALDGAAAVCQHNGLAVVLQQAAKIFFYAALAEIHPGLVFKNKVVHGSTPFLNMILSFVFPCGNDAAVL